jgi:hypothetical protein
MAVLYVMVTVTLSSVTELFWRFRLRRKKFLFFYCVVGTRTVKEYGIHLSLNNIANVYDVKECCQRVVLVSGSSPFCSSCIHVRAQWYAKTHREQTLLTAWSVQLIVRYIRSGFGI